MQKIFMVEPCFSLPLSDVEIVDAELSTILKIAKDSENGFILEVNLDYLDVLHFMHKDFPVAATKKIERNMLSEY